MSRACPFDGMRLGGEADRCRTKCAYLSGTLEQFLMQPISLGFDTSSVYRYLYYTNHYTKKKKKTCGREERYVSRISSANLEFCERKSAKEPRIYCRIESLSIQKYINTYLTHQETYRSEKKKEKKKKVRGKCEKHDKCGCIF